MRNLKRALSLGLTAAMISGLMVMGSSAASYADVTSENNVEAIDVLQTVGIMVGDENGDFNPDQNVTRNEMAVIMANLMEYNVASYKDTSPFTDVPSWAEPYVAACYTNGITAGISDTIYGGEKDVTTAQAALMLMKALGYFQYSSDFGNDWQLATVRQGNNIDLFDGVDSGVTQAMTRNDVAQLVLNTLEAGTVTASTDGSWSIGDIVINNNVTYNYVTSNADYAESIHKVQSTDSNTDAGRSIVELGEQLYQGDLRLREGTSDEFSRPSRTWIYENSEIGTYADTPDLTYTAKVEAGDIYSDLGLGSSIAKDDVVIYVNGLEDNSAVAIRRNSDEKIGQSGNGVLTEVYYDNDNDNDSVIITQVLTYIGEVNRNVAESSSTDAYVEVISSVNGSTAPTGAAGTERFYTDETFDEESYVLYTFSQKEDEMVTVQPAESVSGTVSKVVNKSNDRENSGMTMDGTEYKASATMALDLLSAISVDLDYTAYLDAYGYVITVDEADFGDYALVLDIEGSSNNMASSGFNTNRARLLFTDGTVAVVTLDKNYTSPSNGRIGDKDIVTWRERDDGYALRKVVDYSATHQETWVENSSTFNLETDVARITTGHPTTGTDPFYANSNTMFVIYDNNSDDYDAYEGVKNVPGVAAKDLDNDGTVNDTDEKEGVSAYWYCKNGSIITAMFIIPEDDRLVDESNDLLFLAGESVSGIIHDADGDYYEYEGFMDGQLQTVKIDAGANNKTYTTANIAANKLNGLFSDYTINSDGIITSLTRYTTNNALDKFAGQGVGTDRHSADYTVYVDNGTDTVITTAYNAAQWWTVDEDALFFVIDEDGNIENGSYGSVAVDDDDRAYFVIEDGMVTHMFIETVDTKNNAQPATVGITSNKSISSGTISATPDETVTLTADVTLADRNDRVTSYRWYSATTAQGSLADVEANGTRIGTGESVTVPTDTIGTTYYYVVVETYNERVTGTDTAKSYAGVQVNVAEAAQTMNVVVYYTTTNKDGAFATEVLRNVELDGGVLATVTMADLNEFPEGYDYVSGLPGRITAGATPEVVVVVAESAGVDHVANVSELTTALADPSTDTIYLAENTTYALTSSLSVTGGVEIIGNGATIQAPASGNVMVLTGSADVTISDVVFTGGTSSQYYIQSGNSGDVTVKNCVFNGGRYGVYLDTASSGEISGCTFSNWGKAAIGLEDLTGNVEISNNTYNVADSVVAIEYVANVKNYITGTDFATLEENGQTNEI